MLIGCRLTADVDDGFTLVSNSQLTELGCSLPTDMGDMAPAASKCAAAQGLSGDVLGNFCFDFSSIGDQTLTTSPPQQLPGWSFGTDTMNNDCWELKSGKLQVKNFSGFASTCGFTMPAIAAADFNKYNSFTLSVLQTVDVNKQLLRQSAAIYLGQAVDTQQLWLSTGTNPRQTNTVTVAKSALPNGGSGMYQALFQIISTASGGGYSGWQIESIAILGNPQAR
jgi:hypothetical protein